MCSSDNIHFGIVAVMKNGISASVCLFLQLVLATTADKEYADTKERHYQEGMHNVEFDHEAILGSYHIITLTS